MSMEGRKSPVEPVPITRRSPRLAKKKSTDESNDSGTHLAKKKSRMEYFDERLPKWKEYIKQLHESEGFDVSTLRDIDCDETVNIPVANAIWLGKETKLLLYAEQALEWHNFKEQRYLCKDKWKVDKIIRLNQRGCFHPTYYYTIKAKTARGDHEIFQVKVQVYHFGRVEYSLIRTLKEGMKKQEENRKRMEEKERKWKELEEEEERKKNKEGKE